MISRRLTKIQKEEIVEAYRGGANTNSLAEKYSCSSNTINRTVKTLLEDSEYKLLKEKRLISGNKKMEQNSDKNFDVEKDDDEQQKSFNPPHSIVKEKDRSMRTDNDDDYHQFEEIDFLPIRELSLHSESQNDNLNIEETNQDSDNKLEEIAPLLSDFDFEKKESDFEISNQEILPESLYMVVDKKVELEVKSISDLPEWSFLPENELKRNAIILFLNQRTAKRSCSRNQRVIKIPNTNVFEISKSYLISKGITRLILEDSIIALDN